MNSPFLPTRHVVGDSQGFRPSEDIAPGMNPSLNSGPRKRGWCQPGAAHPALTKLTKRR